MHFHFLPADLLALTHEYLLRGTVPRDPFGVTSMYIGWGKDGSIWVANEMKCLVVSNLLQCCVSQCVPSFESTPNSVMQSQKNNRKAEKGTHVEESFSV